ncbi:MAG: 3'-5' exonuclease, partial [Nitrosopumilus sp.]
WSTQFIANKTDGAEIHYDLSQMTIAFLDIETECEKGFSNAENVTERINAITVRVKDQRWVFGLGEFTAPFKDVDNSLKTECHSYTDEAELLQDFVEMWAALKPDIVSGWNVRFFDIPYLVNRIEEVLSERQAKRLSPWKQIRTKVINKWGQNYTVYELLGISTLDFYELFKKYTYQNQESWKLGHIAYVVLGEKKLSYEEYDHMATFYRENFQKFVAYNVHDVDLVYRMDEKLNLIDLHVSLAYLAKI